MMLHALIANAAPSAEAAGGLVQWLMKLSDAKQPWELWLVAFGLVAQAVFFGRWVVQWIATEKRGASHVPVAFWWLSLVGASLLLVYFIVRSEPVGVLGQCTGWIIYSRNLYLIRKERKLAGEGDASISTNAKKSDSNSERCPACGHEWIA